MDKLVGALGGGIGMVVMTIVIAAVMFGVAALFAMLGWHLFMVPVFGMSALTFWQAIGFVLLLGGTSKVTSGKK